MILNKTHTVTCVVSEEQTALVVKSGDAKVLATPVMIALMEQAAFELCNSFMEDGKTTVGTAIAASHISATPVGMKITATATLTAEDEKTFSFNISAFDEAGLIGEGTHVRAVVNREKFQLRTEAKRSL